MKTLLIAVLAATTAVSGALPAGIAAAQPGYSGEHDRDRDRDHDRDRGGRSDQWDQDAARYRQQYGYRYYGGNYGYQGYQGRWREGRRYPYYRYRDNRIDNWQAYNLPPPRSGYAYYYDPSGDVVMAAIASGIIGMVIGGALAGQDHDHDHGRRPH
jgi:Ni/Co efflux regulator RcnB